MYFGGPYDDIDEINLHRKQVDKLRELFEEETIEFPIIRIRFRKFKKGTEMAVFLKGVKNIGTFIEDDDTLNYTRD